MINGSCLCEKIKFKLLIEPKNFYRCHCSLCRKQSGVGYNLATLVSSENFQWLSPVDGISSWSKPSGYRTDFCNNCGSTVPNVLRGLPYVWIPVGLLDDNLSMKCVGDYCVGDAMEWDDIRSQAQSTGPVESLNSLLCRLEVSVIDVKQIDLKKQ